MPLEDIIGAPVLSMGKAQNALQKASLDILRLFLDEGPDGTLTPRSLSLTVHRPANESGTGNEAVAVEVPLLTLVHLPSLLIDDASIELCSELLYKREPGVEEAEDWSRQSGGLKPPPGLQCRLTSSKAARRNPRASLMNIKMTVRAREPSESLQHIRDRLTAATVG